jgi:Phage integrase family
LSEDEVRALLAATWVSEWSFRGLSGIDRFHLYWTAATTGLRAAALAALTPADFHLCGGVPLIVLPARFNKSRKVKEQPIPPDVAEAMRNYLAGRAAGHRVWDGTWAEDRRGAEMLREDLAAAGIAYSVAGPDGPIFADFHSLRHPFLTMLGRNGVDLRTAQILAGHSRPELTARYSHRNHNDLSGAAGRLPSMVSPLANPARETSVMHGSCTGAVHNESVAFSGGQYGDGLDGRNGNDETPEISGVSSQFAGILGGSARARTTGLEPATTGSTGGYLKTAQIVKNRWETSPFRRVRCAFGTCTDWFFFS